MLEVTNLGVRYGRHVALHGVSAKVGKGEICVVLGANGAGKSSMLKAIAGMVKTESGSAITMNGRPISGMKPHLIVEEGIALVPEGRGIFGDLTVAENLQLGAFAKRARRQEAATLDQIFHLFPRLAERKGQIARTMSGGEQQMVAIGRALMSKPDILMLDEPSLGLSPLLSKDLFKSLAAVAATGVGILLVEQNARLSLKVAARGYLIENGAITGENTAQALLHDPAVVNAYLGGGAGRGRAPEIRLPAGFALPSGLEGLGRIAGDIAARAAAIQNAFVRAMRKGGAAPSAFVGRYDAAKDPDPWAAVAAAGAEWRLNQPVVSQEANRLATEAEQLAARAAERMSAHIRTARLTDGHAGPLLRETPAVSSALKPAAPPAPELPPLARAPRNLLGPSAEPPKSRRHEGVDAEALARRAAERAAAHAQRSRQQGAKASAFVEATHGAPPSLDAAMLAERATARLAAHIRQQRSAAGASPSLSGARAVPLPPLPDRDHPLIGHNSAGARIEDEPAHRPGKKAKHGVKLNGSARKHADRTAAPAKSEPKDDLAALAERAAAISAAHAAERRKSLTVFTIPAATAADDVRPAKPGKKQSRDPAKKKRKKHKEA
jgi:branched-chain amino acid transport system ATP-binding protein